MILFLLVAAIAVATYGLYKHVTLVQVITEISKIEADAVAYEPAVKEKVLAIVASLRAKL
jgi:hypothetical protein